MLDLILTSPTRLIAAICICGTLLLGFAFFLMHLGQKREQVKNLKESIKVAEKVKQNAEDVINRKRGDGIAKLRKLQQDKRK